MFYRSDVRQFFYVFYESFINRFTANRTRNVRLYRKKKHHYTRVSSRDAFKPFIFFISRTTNIILDLLCEIFQFNVYRRRAAIRQRSLWVYLFIFHTLIIFYLSIGWALLVIVMYCVLCVFFLLFMNIYYESIKNSALL